MKNNETHREYEGAGSCPQDLSEEIAKFAIANASKDPSKLNAAIVLTAHGFIDEDGDEALNFTTLVGGSPSSIVDLLIDTMETVCEKYPPAATRIHKALTQFVMKKLVEKSAADRNKSTKEDVASALEALVRSLTKGTEK